MTRKSQHKHSVPWTWLPVSAQLLVTESLDPKHQIAREACSLCGFVRVVT